MTLSDCKHGEIYYWEGADSFINMFNGRDLNHNILYYIYADKEDHLNKLHEISDNKSPTNIRKATLEEEHWLLECIKHKAFIDYDTAMTTFIKPNIKDDPNLNKILIKLLTQ